MGRDRCLDICSISSSSLPLSLSLRGHSLAVSMFPHPSWQLLLDSLSPTASALARFQQPHPLLVPSDPEKLSALSSPYMLFHFPLTHIFVKSSFFKLFSLLILCLLDFSPVSCSNLVRFNTYIIYLVQFNEFLGCKALYKVVQGTQRFSLIF